MSNGSWIRESLKKYSRRHPKLLKMFQASREKIKEREFAACQRENPVDEKLVVFESYWGKDLRITVLSGPLRMCRHISICLAIPEPVW